MEQLQFDFSYPEVQRASTMAPVIPIFSKYLEEMICPICKSHIKQSEYLAGEIFDKKVLYLANMVTHYRHNHVKWDKSWRYMQNKNGHSWDYEKAKQDINERAKRQIIRKCSGVLKGMGIGPAHFGLLENRDSKTLTLAHSLL